MLSPIISLMENDLLIFQFSRPEARHWVLGNGLWHLGGKPILLREWAPGIVPKTFVFDYVPMWIKLAKIPLEMWSKRGLAL